MIEGGLRRIFSSSFTSYIVAEGMRLLVPAGGPNIIEQCLPS
jgi:hypothetical protein